MSARFAFVHERNLRDNDPIRAYYSPSSEGPPPYPPNPPLPSEEPAEESFFDSIPENYSGSQAHSTESGPGFKEPSTTSEPIRPSDHIPESVPPSHGMDSHLSSYSSGSGILSASSSSPSYSYSGHLDPSSSSSPAWVPSYLDVSSSSSASASTTSSSRDSSVRGSTKKLDFACKPIDKGSSDKQQLNPEFQSLDHIMITTLPACIQSDFGLRRQILDKNMVRELKLERSRPMCVRKGDKCRECRGRLPLFTYTLPEAPCRMNGNLPTILSRFKLSHHDGDYTLAILECLKCHTNGLECDLKKHLVDVYLPKDGEQVIKVYFPAVDELPEGEDAEEKKDKIRQEYDQEVLNEKAIVNAYRVRQMEDVVESLRKRTDILLDWLAEDKTGAER